MSKSIKENYIYSVLYQLLSMALPLVTIPYVSRIFGPDGLGIYSYTSSINQYFCLFALLGLNNYGVRSIAMVREDNTKRNVVFSEIYCMQLSISFLVLLLYVLFIVFFEVQYRVFFVILSMSIIATLFDVNWYFFGTEKFKLTVVRNSIIKVLSFAAIFLFIKEPSDLWIYILIHSGSVMLTSIVLWPYLHREITFIKPQITNVIKHVKPNLIMFVPVVAISVYKFMDKIMLGYFSITEAGYYETVEKILTVVLGLVTAFGTVMLPRMSFLAVNESKENAFAYIGKSMDFIMFLSIAIACGIYAVTPDLIPMYFGSRFIYCVEIMEALVITAIISSWANVIRTQYLIPFHHDSVYVWSVILGAVTNFLLNILLIKRFGAMGAVIGTIFAELVVAVIQTCKSQKELPIFKMIIRAIPFLFFGIVMIITVRFVSNLQVNIYIKLIIEILTGAVIYLVPSFLYFKTQLKRGYLN